jgi:DNA-binding transcriptional regulator YiaG/DNA-binding Xre family transcriptional regulator
VAKTDPLAKSKLPEEEKEVARRLRMVREREKFTLQELAIECELTTSALKHYEYGAAAVPLDVGDRICRRLDLNQRWLALGVAPVVPYVKGVELGTQFDRPKRLSLHDAYRDRLGKNMEDWVRQNPARAGQRTGLADIKRLSRETLVELMIGTAKTIARDGFPDVRKAAFRVMHDILFQLETRLADEMALDSRHTVYELSAVEISERLKAKRSELRLTQAQAAAVWDVPLITLQSWEQGRRKPGRLALKQLDLILRSAAR